MVRLKCGLRTVFLMAMGLCWFPVAWADSNYNNRIGLGPPIGWKLIMTYERRLPLKLMDFDTSIGVDLSWQFQASESAFYREDVTFETNTHVINPWFMVYFNENPGFIPNVFIIKPSLVFLDPGANYDNFSVFPAYEIMVGHIFNFNRFYLKIDYGFKHFLRSEKVIYSEQETHFPAKNWTPSAGIYFGLNF
jgi:hypothetical protein